jgi:heme/copper-type cytochrome/quinol oxidase subunit 1
LLVYNILTSLKNGKTAGRDPWDANTLEWMTESPPAVHNFDFTPVVFSERPLFDHKHTPGLEIAVPHEAEQIHMPSYSWKPLFVSLGALMVVLGLLLFNTAPFLWLISVAGAVTIIGGVYAWVSEPV